jgi:hypothetical protein
VGADAVARGAAGGVGDTNSVTIGEFVGPVLAVGRAARAAWTMFRSPTPRLRLDLPAPHGEPTRRALSIVPNGDRWQVVFTLRLVNSGRSPARHWRVRFVTADADTMMNLDQGKDARSVTETWIGPGWQHEVQAAGPSDTVPPKMPVAILGRHTLNFYGRPDSIAVRCWLTADGMDDYEDTLRLELHWMSMTARFRWG